MTTLPLLVALTIAACACLPASSSVFQRHSGAQAPAQAPAQASAQASPPVAAQVSGPVPGAVADWFWPVAGARRIARQYVAPLTPYAGGHRGIDLPVNAGDSVYAPADGVVSFAGTVADRPVLSLAHSDGLVSSFEPVTALVGPGDRVSAGAAIGVVAAGGHCGNGCLHFGVRLHGRYVSPHLQLGGVPRAVLLPIP